MLFSYRICREITYHVTQHNMLFLDEPTLRIQLLFYQVQVGEIKNLYEYWWFKIHNVENFCSSNVAKFHFRQCKL